MTKYPLLMIKLDLLRKNISEIMTPGMHSSFIEDFSRVHVGVFSIVMVSIFKIKRFKTPSCINKTNNYAMIFKINLETVRRIHFTVQ